MKMNALNVIIMFNYITSFKKKLHICDMFRYDIEKIKVYTLEVVQKINYLFLME